MKHLTDKTVPVGAHVCTIRDRRLANAVLVGLVGLAAGAAVWLVLRPATPAPAPAVARP